MSQQTMGFGATAVAEPPAPVADAVADGAADNRRKLLMAGAGVGVLLLAVVGFFLLRGGGSTASTSSTSFPVTTLHHKAAGTTGGTASTGPVKLPKRVVTPVGRDPFKALYAAPVAAPAGAAAAGSASSSSSSSTSSSTGSTPTTTTTGTTTTASAPTYHAVWIRLRSISGSIATFQVGFSNGKTLKAYSYDVKASRTQAVPFSSGRFSLESLRNGVATVKFGDGTPFQLDLTHNTMIVG